MASSHAGTRLPIAAYFRGPGRSPSARPQILRNRLSSFIKKVIATKKQGTPLRAPLRKANKNFLRRHYPHQVKGSKAQPSSQPFAALPPWLPRVFFGFCRVRSCNLHTGKKHFRLSLPQQGNSKTLSNFSIHPMKQFARDL